MGILGAVLGKAGNLVPLKLLHGSKVGVSSNSNKDNKQSVVEGCGWPDMFQP